MIPAPAFFTKELKKKKKKHKAVRWTQNVESLT